VDEAVRSALALVGLGAAADKHPYDLPLSQRRLLALAATLAMQTPAVILDEPTTGQDAPSIERIGRIVEDLKAQGRTVIAISHDIDFCAEHFARVIVMAGGIVLADGSAADVLPRAAVLAQAEVEPPQLLRLAAALGLDSSPLTVEAFVAALSARRSRKEESRDELD
jgi:energy-coupling factor transport system ATP-binding protein